MRRSKRRNRNDGTATSPGARAMGIDDATFERAKREQHRLWFNHGQMISLSRIVERLKVEASGNGEQ